MPETKPPSGLSILAFLNFVFGGMLLLVMLGGLLVNFSSMQRGIFFRLGPELIVSILMIMAGIGYLKQKKFLGRTIGNAYAITAILMSIYRIIGGNLRLDIGVVVLLIYPLLTLILINTIFKDDLMRNGTKTFTPPVKTRTGKEANILAIAFGLIGLFFAGATALVGGVMGIASGMDQMKTLCEMGWLSLAGPCLGASLGGLIGRASGAKLGKGFRCVFGGGIATLVSIALAFVLSFAPVLSGRVVSPLMLGLVLTGLVIGVLAVLSESRWFQFPRAIVLALMILGSGAMLGWPKVKEDWKRQRVIAASTKSGVRIKIHHNFGVDSVYFNINSENFGDEELKQLVPRLKALDLDFTLPLSKTQVTDSGLQTFNGLSNLTGIDLSGTQVGDAGLNHLIGLPRLEKLDLRDTNVTYLGVQKLKQALPNCEIGYTLGDLLQALSSSPLSRTRHENLWGRDIQPPRITDASLEHLKQLRGVQTSGLKLNLNRPGITDVALEHLKGLTNVTYLNLGGAYGARITDVGLQYLKELSSLEVLILEQARITDAGLEHLSGLTELKELDLHSTRISDAGLEHLKGLHTLEKLNIRIARITDAGLVHLKGLSRIRELHLNGTRITDAGLVHLTGLSNLRSLSLDRTQVTDAGLVHLKGLTKLERLELSGRKFTDAGLVHLKGLSRLRELHLFNTQVTDAGLVHLKVLTELQTLSLSGTKVTDEGVNKLRKSLPNLTVF